MKREYTTEVLYPTTDMNKSLLWIYEGAGVALFQEKSYSKALTIFNKLLDINPISKSALIYSGKIYDEIGHKELAERAFSRILDIDPTNIMAYYGLLPLLREKGEHNRAKGILKNALDLYKKNDLLHLEMGHLLVAQKKYFDAINAFNKVIEINPTHCQAYHQLGYIYRILGKLQKAEKFLKKSAEINPRLDDSLMELGLIYLEQKRYDKGIQNYIEAIKRNPQNGYAHLQLGHIYRIKYMVKEGKEVLRVARRLGFFCEQIHFETGLLYFMENEYEKALYQLSKVTLINPKNDAAFRQIARIYIARRKNDIAEENLKIALKLNPRNQWNYLQLGINSLESRKYMDAVMSFRKMITVIDPDSKFNKYFAEILDQNLDYQNAKKIFTSYEFLYKLGRLFYDIDLRIEASRYFRRCLKLKPFDKMALRYQNTLSL